MGCAGMTNRLAAAAGQADRVTLTRRRAAGPEQRASRPIGRRTPWTVDMSFSPQKHNWASVAKLVAVNDTG